jgi:uncharacterized membrane protein
LKDESEGAKSKIDVSKYASQKGFTVDVKVVREKIAGFLAGSAVVACLFLSTVPLWLPDRTAYIKDVLPIFTTLLGTAFGFYFSKERLGE